MSEKQSSSVSRCADRTTYPDHLPPVVETPAIIAREVEECLRERAEMGLPLTIETREVEVEARVTV